MISATWRSILNKYVPLALVMSGSNVGELRAAPIPSAPIPDTIIPWSDEVTRRAAASIIQNAWHEHSINIRAAKIEALQAATRTRAAEKEEERRRARAAADEKYTLPGVLARVWPIVRETMVVMSVAVALLLAAPAAFGALPGPFDVRGEDPPDKQAVAALWGASVAVLAFFFVFLALVLLYVYRWERTLHAAHALYVSVSALGIIYYCHAKPAGHLPASYLPASCLPACQSLPRVTVHSSHATCLSPLPRVTLLPPRRYSARRSLFCWCVSASAPCHVSPLSTA